MANDAFGFSGDPLGLGPRAGGADRGRPVGLKSNEGTLGIQGVKQAILDQTGPKTKVDAPADLPATAAGVSPDVINAINERLARLEAMTVVPGLGHNARFVGGKLELNLVLPDGNQSGFTPRVIIFDYAPPTPDGPDSGDVISAIEMVYNDWGPPYDGSNPLTPQALDFLACNGLNYLVFTDQNFFGTIGAEGYSIIFFVVGGITYTAFSVGGAWANGDGF